MKHGDGQHQKRTQRDTEHKPRGRRKMHGPCKIFAEKASQLRSFGSLKEDLVTHLFPTARCLEHDCVKKVTRMGSSFCSSFLVDG